MSFLGFGKKKGSSQVAPSGVRETHPPSSSNVSIPTVNGLKEKDKQPGGGQDITPGSSVNNSLNSLGGAPTPSPEHGTGARRSQDQDGAVRFPVSCSLQVIARLMVFVLSISCPLILIY